MAKTALCIGINDYPGTQSDLSGCVNDMEDWAATVERRGFAVTRMRDAEATREAMVAAIERLVRDARAGDSLLMTYSGHGTWIPDRSGDEPDQRDECLCPWDIGQNRPLVDDELHDLFARRPHGCKLVFISDSCHSGSVVRMGPPLDGGTERRVRFLPPERFLTGAELAAATHVAGPQVAAASRQGALLMAGCRDTEYSYDASFGGRPNGAFTHVALATLEGLDAGATYRDWYLAIRARLPAPDYPQTPNLFGTAAQKGWRVLD